MRKKIEAKMVVFAVVVMAVILATSVGQALAMSKVQSNQIESLHSEIEAAQSKIEALEAQETITRVIGIYDDNEGNLQTLSLTAQGWFDFMRTYPGYGTIFYNFDFEEMFTFTEVEVEYPEEVEEFFAKDKSRFLVWSPVSGYEDIYGGDFIMCYQEYRDGIRVLFCNQEDELEVEYEFRGAQHSKEVHISGTNRYYLVFEDKDSNLMAICPLDDMKTYQLTPLSTSQE